MGVGESESQCKQVPAKLEPQLLLQVGTKKQQLLLEGSKPFAPPATGRTLIALSLCSPQRGKGET